MENKQHMDSGEIPFNHDRISILILLKVKISF